MDIVMEFVNISEVLPLMNTYGITLYLGTN